MKSNNNNIHPLADVKTKDIGKDTIIWQFTVVMAGVKIGQNCNINAHCLIESNVMLGDNVTVKSGVYLWDGITIENNVFIGPNTTFVNDLYPRSKQYPDEFLKTVIKDGASIGAGSIIRGGITIGKNAMIGAGSLVLHDVPDNTLWFGSPAKYVRDIS